jgi:sulfur-carrier protein adenylyltransferase/sulfurtransferase
VPEIGAAGQQKIAAAKVLVIGAGGLGTPLAVYLAGAGVGTIGIADGDTVALSNLPRQFYYTEEAVGKSKALLLTERLQVQNPSLNMVAYPFMMNSENIADCMGRYDIVCDCTDNMDARVLIDKECGDMQKPLVFAAVKEWEGYVSVLHHTKKTSVHNLFPVAFEKEVMAGCAVTGIVNAACGFAGSMQAAEVIKIILGIPSQIDGGLLCFNLQVPVTRIFKLNRP